jgi:aspartyl-tRNA synthetase
MVDFLDGRRRSHYCGELRIGDAGAQVVLMGWVQTRRDHGGLIFVDLRDRTGLVQVVFSPDFQKEAFEKAEGVRSEYVLCVQGIVRERPEGTANPNLATGQVDVMAH